MNIIPFRTFANISRNMKISIKFTTLVSWHCAYVRACFNCLRMQYCVKQFLR